MIDRTTAAMDGKKTFTGIMLVIVSSLLTKHAPDLASIAQDLQTLGYGLVGIGVVDKGQKAINAVNALVGSPSNEVKK